MVCILKRILSAILIISCLISVSLFPASALETHYQIEQTLNEGNLGSTDEPMASGLIYWFIISISKSGNTTLIIEGNTDCESDVVKCGFKDLKVQRRLNSSSSWTDYYDYGNVYVDSFSAIFGRTLTVEPGYQYRVTCKHYAKKNILNTQTISNTSNIVTF